MPLLIKSSCGSRTAKVVNNQKIDLIEALKGLTLKIELEIKVADIVTTTGETETEPTTTPHQVIPSLKVHPKVTIENSPVTAPIPQDPLTSQVVRPNPTPSVVRPNPEPSVSTPPVKLAPVRPPIDPKPTVIKREIKINPPKREPTPPPKASGTLKTGTEHDVCCVAIEDGTNPPVVFSCLGTDQLTTIGETIKAKAHEIENSPAPSSVKVEQQVFAKSNDDNNWYRAIVQAFANDQVDVFFFDWGLKETLCIDRIRPLNMCELTLSQVPACAHKMTVKCSSTELLNDFLACEEVFKVKIDDYDSETSSHLVSIMKKVG